MAGLSRYPDYGRAQSVVDQSTHLKGSIPRRKSHTTSPRSISAVQQYSSTCAPSLAYKMEEEYLDRRYIPSKQKSINPVSCPYPKRGGKELRKTSTEYLSQSRQRAKILPAMFQEEGVGRGQRKIHLTNGCVPTRENCDTLRASAAPLLTEIDPALRRKNHRSLLGILLLGQFQNCGRSAISTTVTPNPQVLKVTPNPKARKVTRKIQISKLPLTLADLKDLPDPKILKVTPHPKARKVTPKIQILKLSLTLADLKDLSRILR